MPPCFWKSARWLQWIPSAALLAAGCGQDAHHLASIASKMGKHVATGSEKVRETALGRLFQNQSFFDQVPLTDRVRLRLRLDRSLQGTDITVRLIDSGALELTGEVPDEATRQAVVQAAQLVPGVDKVADGLNLPGAATVMPGKVPDNNDSAAPPAIPASGNPPVLPPGIPAAPSSIIPMPPVNGFAPGLPSGIPPLPANGLPPPPPAIPPLAPPAPRNP